MKKYSWDSFRLLEAFVLLITILAACTPTPSIKGFDSTRWKTDSDACLGYRALVADSIIQQKEQFIGITEATLYQVLGKPDKQVLDERNRKTYKYALSCDSLSEYSKWLVIDTDALNRVYLVRIEVVVIP